MSLLFVQVPFHATFLNLSPLFVVYSCVSFSNIANISFMGELLTFVFKTGVVCMFCGHSKHIKNGVQHTI